MIHASIGPWRVIVGSTIAHLGQHLLVRPRRLADKMQQRLVLRRRPGRRRHRRHRLNALARARHHQAGAVIAQRIDPIGVADHARQALDIAQKTPVAAVRTVETHPGSPAKMNLFILPEARAAETAAF
jgi:hypothetical protein